MTLKNDLKSYRSRWATVEAVVRAERRTAPVELRWKQMNSAYGLAKGLGLLKVDPSEMEVFQTWALIKEKKDHPIQKA